MAPDFTLPSTVGDKITLSDYRGKKSVVLLFYPGDETPICTRQMCSVRDRWEDYAATGAEVVGVSTNSVESHKSFTEHHDLPLRLLADTERKVADMYGAQSLIPGKVARSVFVIDGNGVITYRMYGRSDCFDPRTTTRLRRLEPRKIVCVITGSGRRSSAFTG
jgi:peroxiredoxin Q/BCP